nr:hypothetical protein CTI12_AA063150 [Tanacetum cinerariifolium]
MIQDFYSSMSALWDQLALTEPTTLSSFDPYFKRRESQRLVQFLMALRYNFEGLRGLILHREPLPPVDSVVSELLAEEIRLKSLDDQKIVTQQGSSIFVASQRSFNGIKNLLLIMSVHNANRRVIGNLSVLFNQSNHHTLIMVLLPNL